MIWTLHYGYELFLPHCTTELSAIQTNQVCIHLLYHFWHLAKSISFQTEIREEGMALSHCIQSKPYCVNGMRQLTKHTEQQQESFTACSPKGWQQYLFIPMKGKIPLSWSQHLITLLTYYKADLHSMPDGHQHRPYIFSTTPGSQLGCHIFES